MYRKPTLITTQENGIFVPVFAQIKNTEGGELDLSAFGNVVGQSYPAGRNYPQQIEFAGKLQLVLEAGILQSRVYGLEHIVRTKKLLLLLTSLEKLSASRA